MKQSQMTEEETEVLSKLVEHFVGVPIETARTFDLKKADRWCAIDQKRREFENAHADFITVVLTTPLIQPGEEVIRVELLKIPQLLLDHHWSVAMSIDNTRSSGVGNADRPLYLDILQLLRQTRLRFSRTEDARDFMRHGRSYPTDYPDPNDQKLFESIVESMRNSLQAGQ